ncbi:MAG: zinc ribbon domain-containing protein [Bacteroidales bacterium]|nr:zinc ribbon domain-containing protein [Bacteroidales bacterium]
MAYCIKCGAELREGDNFCQQCGAPVEGGTSYTEEERTSYAYDDKDDDDDEPVQSSPFYKEKARSSGLLRKIMMVALPTILVLAGTAAYSFFKGDGEVKTEESTTKPYFSPNILVDEETNNTQTEDNSVAQESTTSDPIVSDTEGIDGIVDIDTDRYEAAYRGVWESVGLALFPFSEVEELRNMDVAELIEQNMRISNIACLYFGDGEMKLTLNGKTSLSGRYMIRESGNISVETPSGENGAMWMYSPSDGVLFSYLFYVEDDGKEMASAIKFRRVRN